jgi:hypothetical protein
MRQNIQIILIDKDNSMTRFQLASLCLLIILTAHRAHSQNEENLTRNSAQAPINPSNTDTSTNQNIKTADSRNSHFPNPCQQFSNQGWQLLAASIRHEKRIHSPSTIQFGECLLTDAEVVVLIAGDTQFSRTDITQLHSGQGFFLRYKIAEKLDSHTPRQVAIKNRGPLFNRSCSALDNTPLTPNIPLLLGLSETIPVTIKNRNTIVMQHCQFHQAILMVYQQGQWERVNNGSIKAGQGFLLKYQQAISTQKNL